MQNQRIIDRLEAAFEAHGYFIDMEPIEGEEEAFIAALRNGFAKVETVLAINAKRYGYRGLSKAALKALHNDLPVPTWGVELL